MSDNSLPAMPTSINDYQPPQSDSGSMNVPSGFNPPPAPVSTQMPTSVQDPALNQSTTQEQKKIEFIYDEDTATPEQKILMTPWQPPAASTDSVADSADQSTKQSNQPSQSVGVSAGSPNQSLESQNIFDMLGVSDGKPEEKEAFLDELQDVMWEDFLAHDAELLLSEADMAKLNEIKAKGNAPEVQEEILVFLEKLIPDLEDMMMDKAIELKEDMVMERIAGMREFHSQNAEALEKITQAEKMISEGLWADATQLLNSIK
jgi:hypothetical protein